jgi:hypothetical protein
MEENDIPKSFIYFIYSQQGNQNNIAKFEKNKIVTKVEKEEEKIINQEMWIIYQIELSDGYKDNPFTLIMIDKSLNYYYKDIYPGKYQFDIKFIPLQKKETDSLNQVSLSFIEQFNIFKGCINNKLEDLNELFICSIHYSNEISQDSYYNFMLFLFTEIYQQYKKDPNIFKEAIKKYFEDLKIQLFEERKKHKYDKFSKPKIDDNLKDLSIFSDVNKIREELILITNNNEKTNTNIDVFLCFYFIHFKPKLFIKYIDIHNANFEEIKSHLLSNKRIFNGFNAEIMNFELMEETENLEQIQTIVLYFIPNRLEFFKILANRSFYSKMVFLSDYEAQMENLNVPKKIKLCEQQNGDDIKEMSNYFDNLMKFRKEEYNVFPIIIDENFFINYCEMYKDKNCGNLRSLKKMYDRFYEIYKKKPNIGIDSYYHKTGMDLMIEGKLYNNDLLVFLSNDPNYYEGDLSIIDSICKFKGIRFDKKNKKFANDFFNNQIDEIDVRKLFGINYKYLLKSILSLFKEPKDLLSINNLQFEEPVHEDLIELFLDMIKRIWTKNPKSDMFDSKKLIGDVLRLASKKFGFFEKVIGELENEIFNSCLLPIYSEILYRYKDYSSDFKKHIINYIEKNYEKNVISIWYRFTALFDEEKKTDFLKNNLKEECAVRAIDFVSYPENKTERIILFTSLVNSKIFNRNRELQQLNYYKKSIEAKKDIPNLKCKDAIKMSKDDKKYQHIQNLLFNFFIGPRDDSFIIEYLLPFSENCENANYLIESLKNLAVFWKKFFKSEKKKSVEELEKLQKKILDIPINECNNFKNEKCASYLDFFKIANEGVKLKDSLFFNAIYESNKEKNKKIKNNKKANETLKELKK